MPVNFKIQVLTLHFHWESSKTATCINWFTPGLQEQRCYKSVPWIFCVVLKSGTANTIHLISLTFHRFFEKKASTSMCWNLALVLTDAFQEHPCSEDLWTMRKTLLLEQITSREPGDPLKAFSASTLKVWLHLSLALCVSAPTLWNATAAWWDVPSFTK